MVGGRAVGRACGCVGGWVGERVGISEVRDRAGYMDGGVHVLMKLEGATEVSSTPAAVAYPHPAVVARLLDVVVVVVAELSITALTARAGGDTLWPRQLWPLATTSLVRPCCSSRVAGRATIIL